MVLLVLLVLVIMFLNQSRNQHYVMGSADWLKKVSGCMSKDLNCVIPGGFAPAKQWGCKQIAFLKNYHLPWSRMISAFAWGVKRIVGGGRTQTYTLVLLCCRLHLMMDRTVSPSVITPWKISHFGVVLSLRDCRSKVVMDPGTWRSFWLYHPGPIEEQSARSCHVHGVW